MFIVELFRVYLNSYWSVCMNFPKIHKITISNFSLYKQKDKIELDLNDGVFCLAGANGLGKSTFIAIVSYALMGIVVDPKKNFDSINQITEFYKKNEKFAEIYFEGRIDESKRDLAWVGIEFTIGDFRYKLKRNFFETMNLLEFSRVNTISNEETIIESSTSSELLEMYKKYLTQDIGVVTFEQYAFLQSFVLTFDESKKLIFWDTQVMNRILHLFFGIEPEYANRADDLRKKISKHESNMRNIQWNITQNEREIVEITNPSLLDISIEDAETLIKTIKENEKLMEEVQNNIEKQEMTISECDLNIKNFAIKIVNLNAKYEEVFQSLENSEILIEKDSSIVAILRKISNKILNNEDTTSDFDELKMRIIEVSKTLCEHYQQEKAIELKNIDNEIMTSKKEQEEYIAKKNRIEKEICENKKILEDLKIKLNDLKYNNAKIIKQYDLYISANSNERVNSIKNVIENDKIRKIEECKLRDKYKEELSALEKDMRTQYHKTEIEFIPIFKKYATNFLGLDIDIELKNTASTGLYLSLKVNNTERKDKYQLSESQQYFIDIALRFALIEISGAKYATIFIDTPEGSLDIAYESRAGKMFGDFVTQGFDIIMTANINSSQLLLQLAKKCSQEKMKIERMTEWTILSTVQQEEQDVIEKAFSDIEGALNGTT